MARDRHPQLYHSCHGVEATGRKPRGRKRVYWVVMNTAVIVSVISAASSVIAAAVSFYLTKEKEREADWRKYKFEQYKEFLISLSGIVGQAETPEGPRNFAEACNTLYQRMASTHIETVTGMRHALDDGFCRLPCEMERRALIQGQIPSDD